MHTSNLRKVGGSVMLVVPPAILEMLDLRAGTTVSLAVSGKSLVVQPQLRPHYTLDQLLAQCDANAPVPDASGEADDQQDKAWPGITPVGREL